jgi:predicted nuclease of restriction endonuclease-like RecB superfamily
VPESKVMKRQRGLTLDALAELGSIRPLRPAYLTCADGPWLQSLLDERARFVGQPRRVWRMRVSEPLAVSAPAGKLRVAVGVLDKLARDRVANALAPRRLRAVVFREAARQVDRGLALDRAAAQLGLSREALLTGLFADLPDERTLAPLVTGLDAIQLALLCNESIVHGLLQLALRVRIVIRGQARAVLRHAKWLGLLCVVHAGASEEQVVLEVSGPYALFRHTRLYGRALVSLVPRLARCDSYQLEADCVIAGGREVGRLLLRSNDPIRPARELPRFDSAVEERFAREFARLAREWDVVRDPQPLPIGRTLFFPDFQLRRRSTGECFWLEIVGYWTPQYLAKKLAQLEQAKLQRLILCIDDSRQCADEELQPLGFVIRYKRSVDVRAVIAVIDPALSRELAEQDVAHNSSRASRSRRRA